MSQAVVIPCDNFAPALVVHAIRCGFDPVLVTLDVALVSMAAADGAAWWAVEDEHGTYPYPGVLDAYKAWASVADVSRRVSLTLPKWTERIAATAAGRI